MSFDRSSPVVKRPPRLRTASDTLASIPGLDVSRSAARPIFTVDREAMVEKGLWGFAPLDPRARAFVRLRAQLLTRLMQGSCGKVIAVVSPGAGSGKSFVATNLAAALGELNSVCLVDLDLRNPAIGPLLGVPECTGMESLLTGERRLAEIGCIATEARLVVLPVKQSADATRLLGSDALPTMFDALRRDPETICIVDTPPVLDMDDAIIITRQVDGVLLVIEEGRTTTSEVRETLRLLQPTPLIGTIINRALD